jgi:hypothetical protein
MIQNSVPLHENSVEDLTIRGIWSALLEPLLLQLEDMDRTSGIV